MDCFVKNRKRVAIMENREKIIQMLGNPLISGYGIEITMWNKTNVVVYVNCNCGQLARKELRKYNHFKCYISVIIVKKNIN